MKMTMKYFAVGNALFAEDGYKLWWLKKVGEETFIWIEIPKPKAEEGGEKKEG